jgi:hypothetical protein
MKSFFETWGNLGRFKKQTAEKRKLVVYSEGQQDWPHMGPLIQQFLLQNSSEHISYLSSGKSDPGLAFAHDRFHSFYIGSGIARTTFFRSADVKMMLMTLPDLNIYHLKKSVFPVHYAYCYHSINSTHIVYREKAFEFYDTILCVGDHHLKELRKEEELKKIKPRKLLEHGSVKLDTIYESYAQYRAAPSRSEPLVLLAPSWGEGSFAEEPELLRSIIRQIIKQGVECKLRLHPMTIRHHPQLVPSIRKDFAAEIQNRQFDVEDNLNDNSSLRDATVMVSDWSGAATEFAFGLERPVLFINTKQKINNPNWKRYDLLGIEDFIRHEIGIVIQPNEIDQLSSALEKLISQKTEFASKIILARGKWIFNLGSSAHVGAKHLTDLLQTLTNT